MRGKKLKCSWRRINGGFRWIDFTVMLDVLEFSLDNAIFRMKDGRIVRQRKGIPMGDALSPAMTIGTCGWMEREWMNGLDVSTKGNFKAKRYMDDILLFFRKHGWDRERFYGDFKKSECYMPPLKLEEAADGTFLETSFRMADNHLYYRLKNANEGGKKATWRYHGYDSYSPMWQKRSTMVATLKKVDFMASDRMEKLASAMDKLREFEHLGYPARVRRQACAVMARERNCMVWGVVAALQR